MAANYSALENERANGKFSDNQMISQIDSVMLPFFKVTLFVSDEVLLLNLTSLGFDTAKVARKFITIDNYLSQCDITQKETKTYIAGLKFDHEYEFVGFKAKQFTTTDDLYLDYENTYDICFQDSDELAVSEIYDRILFSLDVVCDNLFANIILHNLQTLIQGVDEFFYHAKLSKLLDYKSNAFEKQSVSELSDILDMKEWSANVSTADKLYSDISNAIIRLKKPQHVLEVLIADLKDREQFVAKNRCFSSGNTLEQLGTEMGLTRERVRQLAEKVMRKIRASRSKLKLIRDYFFTLKALCENEFYISDDEIIRLGTTVDEIICLSEILGETVLLPRINGTDIFPFKQKLDRCEWAENIEKQSNSLPSLLTVDEKKAILNEMKSALIEEGFDIPLTVISEIAFRRYIPNGNILIHKSLRMGDRYEIVLEKYFPNGIKLYQTEEMERFRRGYATLFNDDKIADNDHAISARVADRCMLIDRGTYILNKQISLPPQLVEEMLQFIQQYPFDMVMTNAIQHRFNDELLEVGIENKYYLLSVLKQYFHDRYSFRRDYVVKGSVSGSFYSNITDFVKECKDGVSFNELQEKFQGIPDTVIYFALSEDENVIPMYNKMYMHKSNIIFPEQKSVLHLLKQVVAKECIVPDERAFSLIKREHADFIANNNINTGWYLFSIIRAFFSDDFKFSRPHIIDEAFDSENGQEALKSSFWGKKYVSIDEIKSYAKEKQIQIYDLSKLLNSYCDRYFILSKEKLVSIDELGFSKSDFAQIEAVVISELGNIDFSEVSRLNIMNKLPKGSIPLTEWLIYSIINRFGTQTSAITSTSQFIHSVPIVMKNGTDIDLIRDSYASSTMAERRIKIDDLSNIDSLVEDIIDSEFFWEERGINA